MAAPRNTYVDPVGGVDFATGGLTVGDPYLTITFANTDIVASHAGPHVDGEQVNVKSTGDDTPAASLVTPGAPAVDAPYIIRGYDEVANDGGIGGIDGAAGGFSIMDQDAAGEGYTHFIDMHLHNTGAAAVIKLRDNSSVQRCEVDTATDRGIEFAADGNIAVDNYVHDVTLESIFAINRALIFGNYIESSGLSGIEISGLGSNLERNIIICGAAATHGIQLGGASIYVLNNSILSTAAGTGSGITMGFAPRNNMVLMNNLIEGFSGAGGAGIDFNSLAFHMQFYGNNSFFDNTDDVSGPIDYDYEADNDLAMTESPFQKVGALTFANRFTYFKPVRIGSVKAGAFPNGSRFDRGAVNGPSVIERVIQEQTTVTIPERTVFDQIPD